MAKIGNQSARVVRISGPVVGAIGLERARLFDVVRVGEIGLVGEIIRLAGEIAVGSVLRKRRVLPAWWRSEPACGAVQRSGAGKTTKPRHEV